jgi:AcrR family transcriptional regulator
MAAPQDNIREQLTEARRAQILDAAAAVFAGKGYHRATTKDIAAAAGVSEGSIYYYFENKADLLIGMLGKLVELDRLDEEMETVLQSEKNGVRDSLLAIFRHRLQQIEDNHELIKAMLPEVIINPELNRRFHQQFMQRITDVLEHYLQSQIDLGLIRPINISQVTQMVQSIFIGLMVMRFIEEPQLLSQWEQLPETLTTVAYDGLKPQALA